VKKFLLFFVLILSFGCQHITNNSNKFEKIDCPNVYFSSENKVYTGENINNLDLEQINFKASLNNYAFTNGCFSDSIDKNYYLDILILVEPINLKENLINLPIFIILYDETNSIIDRQYFRVTEELKYQNNINELKTTINLFTPKEKNLDSITIGFVKIED
tara:strand:+ start:135 stop:617 length:483 start_codon:yes stop_codon:yes gene_type:complete